MPFFRGAERVAEGIAKSKITFRPAEKALMGGFAHTEIEAARLTRSAAEFNKVNAIKQAKKGKITAARVAGGVAGLGAFGAYRNRSGRAADRVMGRPTGPYGY